MLDRTRTLLLTTALAALTAACSKSPGGVSNGGSTGQGFNVSAAGSLAFSGPAGGPFAPGSVTVTIANAGQEDIDWSASVSQGWLQLSQTSGQVAAGSSAQFDVILVGATAQGLVPAGYAATCTVANVTQGGQEVLNVGLLVSNPGSTDGGGLFMSSADLDRARLRAAASVQPFASSYASQRSWALNMLGASANPFTMADLSQITFGWCGQDNNGVDDSLNDAVVQFDIGSDQIRTLALEYALSGERRFGDKAVELMRVWAAEHTLVNVYDYNPIFGSARIDGQTNGYCSDRPWNFALDAMWQAYGLMNASDAYLLLSRNGYALSPSDDAAFRGWILRATEAVNSSFHAWTRWADANPNSSSYERYRSDNHLSWCLAGILAGAVALDDAQLQAYVFDGSAWTDSRAGSYANPSPIFDVIDRAIESGTGAANEGRIYDERILRDPPIGYAFFHLYAMTLVARITEANTTRDVWNFTGSDGAGLKDAFDRYADFILGNRTSPNPGQEGDLTIQAFQYEMAYAVWPDPLYVSVLNTTNRLYYKRQAIGPVVLLVGEDLP